MNLFTIVVFWLLGDSTAKAPPVAVSATPVAAPMAAPRLTVSVVPKENTSTSEPSSSPPNSRKYDLQCATTNGSTSEKMAGENESLDDNEVEHSYEPVTIGAQVGTSIVTTVR